MLYRKKYLIRTHKTKSAVQYGKNIVNFEFSNVEGRQTIKFESQIGNFFEYEKQLQRQLKRLDFKVRPWVKNALYFSIPNNLHEVQMRCFFDSADHVDAGESYLLKENIAILLAPELKEDRLKTSLFIGLFTTKLEFSVIDNFEFKYIKTLYADMEIMSELQDLARIVEKYVAHIEKEFDIQAHFLISDQEHREIELFNDYKRIHEYRRVIMKGLKIASDNEVLQLYNRLAL